MDRARFDKAMKPEPSDELLAWARERLASAEEAEFRHDCVDPGCVHCNGAVHDLARSVMAREDALLAENARLREALAVYACEIERVEKWLRECSAWMLATDLDMQCPMEGDPLDLADSLAAARAPAKGLCRWLRSPAYQGGLTWGWTK